MPAALALVWLPRRPQRQDDRHRCLLFRDQRVQRPLRNLVSMAAAVLLLIAFLRAAKRDRRR